MRLVGKGVYYSSYAVCVTVRIMDLGLTQILIVLLPGVIAYVLANNLIIGSIKPDNAPLPAIMTFLNFSATSLAIYSVGFRVCYGHFPDVDFSNTSKITSQLPWLIIIAIMLAIIYSIIKNNSGIPRFLEFIHLNHYPDSTAWNHVCSKLGTPSRRIDIRLKSTIISGWTYYTPLKLMSDTGMLLCRVCIYEKLTTPNSNQWYWGKLQEVNCLYVDISNPEIISIEFPDVKYSELELRHDGQTIEE